MTRKRQWQGPCWCGGAGQLVTMLGNHFGRERVLVHSPYHIQITIAGADPHNVWINDCGVVSYKLGGSRGRARVASSGTVLFRELDKLAVQTDLDHMREALSLTELIGRSERDLKGFCLQEAIFTDAGFKDGKARIGMVYIKQTPDGPVVKAQATPVDAANIHAAEALAIKAAMITFNSHRTIPTFNDNKPEVERAQATYGSCVRWIGRGENKVADKLANMRGKRGAS